MYCPILYYDMTEDNIISSSSSSGSGSSSSSSNIIINLITVIINPDMHICISICIYVYLQI